MGINKRIRPDHVFRLYAGDVHTENIMARKDFYYNKAKQEGYRSRAAYKLQQLNETEDLFSPGDTVVDLGAAPGGWMQIAANAVGASGTVIGVDFQRIDDIADVPASCESIRGDVTEESTISVIHERLPGGSADVVLSDMAPEMTGEYGLDQARSVYLAEQARETAVALLAPGGHFVVKVFQGQDVDDLRERMETDFEYVRATSPDASRDSSSEIYLLGVGYINAPVTPGDRLTVEITEMGAEGDGIAVVDGFTVFIPGTAVGENVEISITDVKPRFGFGQLVD